MRLPAYEFCDLIWAWCLKRFHKQEDLEQWVADMEAPLPEQIRKKKKIGASMSIDDFKNITSDL